LTLRYALNHVEDGDSIVIDLEEEDTTITLTSPLPQIEKRISINGQGATLTQSGMTSSLLYINATGKAIGIRRLHFTGGSATSGAAIYVYPGVLTLESCIFSNNQATASGGAVYNGLGALTVRGCTFYNNSAGTSGAIYDNSSTTTLHGNLFFGNTADSRNVLYSYGTVTAQYNVSDKASGTNDSTGSGFSGATNVFSVAVPPILGATFEPVVSSAVLSVLPVTLPTGYPAVDFYGKSISASGAAGAVQPEGWILDYAATNLNGQVSVAPGSASPNAGGFYADNASVTLKAEAAADLTGVSFSHWTVNTVKDDINTSPSLTLSMDGNKTVRAVFTRHYEVNAADDAGAATAPTLRYALTNLGAGDSITLPANQTITLTSSLPAINYDITINGNGATLVQGFAPTDYASLLRITGGTVKISRLHFKDGIASTSGAAIYTTTTKPLTLESCIFSNNKTTATNSQGSGGAIYNGSALTVKGCTFYNNTAGYRGGAIFNQSGSLSLTGNLFFGNTAVNSGNVVYRNSGTVTSGGYNVSDKADGTTNSGYMGQSSDVFDAALPISPVNFKPITGGKAMGVLPSPLPNNYPTVDFYGQSITPAGAAGAVQALTAAGYYLDYGVNHAVHSTVSPGQNPREDGLYNNNTNVTLTVSTNIMSEKFSHWIINGVKDEATTASLTVTMDAHKTVRAVFVWTWTVTDEATFRSALNSALDDDIIDLPSSGTISLKQALPQITKSITINGNGATLTRDLSWTATSAISQLLYINSATATVTISRLHFKGGKAASNGGAIRNTGNLTLESCIFSGNEAATNGGAVYTTTGALLVQGCTFYNNKATATTIYSRGGAIYCTNGTVALTGNLFTGNTAVNSGNVVYGTGVTSGGYNVSDMATGAVSAVDNLTDSGYTGTTGDLFNVKDIVFATGEDPTTSPSSNANLNTLTGSLPAGFPTTYFDGTTRELPATAGAVKAQ
jgi:predicted outer membrane repeat protein